LSPESVSQSVDAWRRVRDFAVKAQRDAPLTSSSSASR
jgi:hypothetical protein